jgi:signal transduction histidine kinase
MCRVPSWALGDLTSQWFPFGVHLIKGFFQTVRRMDTMSRERAKLIGPGERAATCRHEINNPAAAATRAVDALRDTFNSSLASLLQLAAQTPVGAQFTAVDALRNEIPGWTPGNDPMAVVDRENALIDWLDTRGVENSWELAPPLASAGVDVAWCERAASILDGPTLGPGLEWVARTVATQSLLSEIKDSTGRVSKLVEDMGSYTQLDRAPVQMIDVTEGIESTLRMLDPKLRQGITVSRDYGSEVPEIEALPAELNQVWTNLIVNAVDAMEGSGTLRISTRHDGDEVVVEIGDTGPGMPVEVQARAFDPFFTTKDVGKGTGLGLDISRRIVVDGHHGHIYIEMRPGETVICVRLPLRRS